MVQKTQDSKDTCDLISFYSYFDRLFKKFRLFAFLLKTRKHILCLKKVYKHFMKIECKENLLIIKITELICIAIV